MLAELSPVLHRYVLPPDAVSVVLLPSHIVVVPPMVIVGRGIIVTSTASAAVPQTSVTVKVYVVDTAGSATGYRQVVQLNPVDGAHEKVPAPLPVKVVLLPAHIVASGPALAEGSAEGEIVITSVAVPQLLVTASV